MINANVLFNAYIDVNLLLALFIGVWFLSARLLDRTQLAHAYTARLRVLRAVFLAIIISPAFVALFALVSRAGYVPQEYGVNLADFIVAQYLQGRFEMNPSALEELLSLRSRAIGALATPLGHALQWVLAAGIGVGLLRLGASMLKLRRIIAESYVWRRFGRVELRLSDTANVPFSMRGLRARIVVLPTAMLARERDLQIALGHELQHLRQGDVEWEILLGLVQPFMFWNPAFYMWKHQVEELRELSCDRQVLSRRGYDLAAYCDCLLRVCHDGLRPRRLLAIEAPVVALVRTENRILGSRSAALLKRRMMSVIDGRAERRPGLVFALLAAPALALTLTASLAIQKPGDWSQDRIMLSTIVNLERLEAVNGPVPSFGLPGY